jgi:hypothetical protein
MNLKIKMSAKRKYFTINTENLIHSMSHSISLYQSLSLSSSSQSVPPISLTHVYVITVPMCMWSPYQYACDHHANMHVMTMPMCVWLLCPILLAPPHTRTVQLVQQLAVGWTVQVSRYSTPVHTSHGAQPTLLYNSPSFPSQGSSCQGILRWG